MIYRIVLNGSVELYGTDLYYDDKLKEQVTDIVLNPSLEIELNSAGTLTFTLPPEHVSWGTPSVFKDEIDVYEGDDIIWFGRPLEITRDWKNQRIVKCEGALAYFNDSIQRPNEYKMSKWWLYEDPDIPDSIGYGFINDIVATHNLQVPANRAIQIGRITVENVPVYRETNYDKTSDVLQQMCLDTSGGFFVMRKDDNIRYLDWLAELPPTVGQEAAFAVNLLDLTQDLNGADICSVLIPKGADDKLINTVETYDGVTNKSPWDVDGQNTFLHEYVVDEIILK